MSLNIETIVVTNFEQNCRVLWNKESNEAVVVDPGGETSKIIQVLVKHDLVCNQIWLTHSHLDHCGGVKSLKSNYPNATLYGHSSEKIFRQNVSTRVNPELASYLDMYDSPEPDLYFRLGDVVTINNLQFQVRFTPGHSPGHIVFYQPEEELLLAGDTVFNGSIGRTDLPMGDHETLLSSIQEQILSLPDRVKILCGHGQDTTVGKEPEFNPFFENFR
jgi:hydroxyacylglutathione hydrolase